MTHPPKLIFTGLGTCNKLPLISVVIPVFNQELRIKDNIISIVENLTVPAEVIVINDASNDKTLHELVNLLPSLTNFSNNISSVRLYSFDDAAFETMCDSFGVENSAADYVLEVQADMYINEYGFDKKMLGAIKKYSDILMLSGRGAEKLLPIQQQYENGLGSDRGSGSSLLGHIMGRILKRMGAFKKIFSVQRDNKVSLMSVLTDNLVNEIYPDPISFEEKGIAGRLGLLIEVDIASHDKFIWLSETVMRGPLLIDKKKYAKVGGLDSRRFFQGYDDHDLAIRGWELECYRCAYIPISFYSPIEAGTTRIARSIGQEIQIFKNLWRINSEWKSSALYRAKEILRKKPIKPEIRHL